MAAKVLYMEDDKFTAAIVVRNLMSFDFEVDVMENGTKGLEALRNGTYDVVLADYEMPDLTGIEVLEEVLKEFEFPAFVVLTGHGDESVAVQAMKLGATDYIVKDSEGKYLKSLPTVIERALQRKQLDLMHKEAQRKLQESEKRYRDIFDSNPAIQLILDPLSGEIIDCNHAATRFYGYSKEELLERTIFDLAVADNNEIQEKLRRAASEDHLFYAYKHKLKGGEIRSVEVFTGGITLENKRYLHSIIHDVTHRVSAETELRGSDDKFQKVFERTRDGVCIIGKDGVIEEWNAGAEKILGMPAQQVLKRPIWDVLFREAAGLSTEYQRETFIRQITDIANRRKAYIEHESEMFLTQSGSIKHVDMSVFPVDVQNDLVICLMMHDMTEQMNSEEEIRTSEHKMRLLFESIADAVFILDQSNGRLVEANSAACALYGYTHEEMCSLFIEQLSAEPEKTRVALKAPKAFIPLRYHKKRNGSTFPAEITTNGVRMNDMDVIVCTVRNITERLELQQELERSVALMEVVNDSVVDAILVVNSQKQILSYNQRFVQYWSVPHSDSFDPNDEESMHRVFMGQADDERILKTMRSLNEKADNAYGILQYPDGREFEVHTSPLYVRGKLEGKVWSFRDLTQRKQAEEQLSVSQARLKAIFDNAAVGITLLDRDGHFTQFNEMLVSMLGYSTEELSQISAIDISGDFDKQPALQRLDALFRGENHGYRIEKMFLKPDGEELWVDFSVNPIRNKNGEVEAAIGILADITQKKQFEDDLQAKNEELNAFAHSVAHDLKNPVSVVKGLADLLQTDLYDYEPDELYEVISKIKKAGQTMENIIDALLLLSRVRDEKIAIAPFDIRETLQNAIAQIEPIIDRKNAVLHLPTSFPECVGYAPWVQIVWTNYMSNAIKYGGENPIVTVYHEIKDGNQAFFYVQDNGRGLTDEDKARLFTPYQRLKRTDEKGHGLGLSIVKRILERLNGTLGVTDGDPSGAVFYFSLPLLDSEQQNE